MKLIMTLLVRDEIDIVESNLSFHLESGVDHIVAIDNGSVDGTRDILADFARQGLVKIIDEPVQNFDQGAWMTNAAILARDELGADWILNNDADEFWVSRNGHLKDLLRASSADILSCSRLNMVYPWDDERDESWAAKCIYRVRKPFKIPRLANRLTDDLPCPYFYLDLPNKALVRASRLTQIAQGNHSASFDYDATEAPGEIDIFHFPIRSTSQFRSKVVNGGGAYARNTVLPAGMGWHWRRWYRMLQTKGIEATIADAFPNREALKRGLADGIVVEDYRMNSLINRQEN
ncbi:MAG: glycosyltransferase family 2 protein [Roseovarius sp.]